jgi:hypothetical protein
MSCGRAHPQGLIFAWAPAHRAQPKKKRQKPFAGSGKSMEELAKAQERLFAKARANLT